MRRANTGHQADARAVTLRINDKRRLLKCLSCGLEANRDAAGVLNMATSMEVALTGTRNLKGL
jgi:transposase